MLNILKAQIVSCDRTLEQKISDAGPNPQRVEPSVLTVARKELVAQGVIRIKQAGKVPWYYLNGTYEPRVEHRMKELVPLHEETQRGTFTHRLGQTLEIAVEKAIKTAGLSYLGHFTDIDKHDDGTGYNKVDPPLDLNGRRMEKGPLDFVIFPAGVCTGIEVKNYRTWLYPRSREVKELLWKCADVGAVPVLIARRLPFITIRLLQMGGCLIHENYNQIYPKADEALAEKVRAKYLLGYHDVRVGNEPDARLIRFIKEQLPTLVTRANRDFQMFRELHLAYGKGEIRYLEWFRKLRAARPDGWTKDVQEEARAEAKDEVKKVVRGRRGRGSGAKGR
ncbi:MAG TPA: hypothetical protein VF753_16825 [Terriglobales bacterium]